MPVEIENIYKEIRSLYNTARVVRTAHFLAAQGDQRMHRILGTGVILLNIMIFSPLFDLTAPTHSATIIKFLAIVAASFAGLQTLFAFQKDAESHLSAGDIYGSITRKTQILLAEHKDHTKDSRQITDEFKALTLEYLQANKDYKGSIPSEREYKKARRVIKRLDEMRLAESPLNIELTPPQTTSSPAAADKSQPNTPTHAPGSSRP